MDVRIGIVQTPKELEVELGDDADHDKVLADIEAALGRDEGVLWLTDRRGRRVAVPVAKVAYVEVGAAGQRAPGRLRGPLSATGQSAGQPPGQPGAVPLLDLELVFVTGKGGVGKTTVAAALAQLAAERGKRVLACEVDAKGDLASLLRGGADRLRRARGGARRLRDVDGHRGVASRVPASSTCNPGGREDGPLAEAFDFVATAAPGVREILTVGKLCYEVRENNYDLVVVDASATGHIVGQLAAPQAINDLVKVGLIRSQTDWMLDILSDPRRTGLVACDHPRGDAGGRDAGAGRPGWPPRPRCGSRPWSSTGCCPSCSPAARRRSSSSSAPPSWRPSCPGGRVATWPRSSRGRAWP